ncbi:TPA: hypothetical protein KRE09_000421 [Clostridioides difficile]|nr:hypothetical protein [Clostridioides difficile]MBF9831264.1 hypothetical protein [Clostridioides difficile]MBF9994721.1 hypothetical protein [Clostridioides difficile]MBG0031220.1 hypothetical protein [Clostridioides difficile]MBH7257498.1 hypothetical protein [Clostridioides difficile]MBH7268432.1 hypothetical protein [Clostridioides difficile]
MLQDIPQNLHGKTVWCSGCRFSFPQSVSRPFLEQKMATNFVCQLPFF